MTRTINLLYNKGCNITKQDNIIWQLNGISIYSKCFSFDAIVNLDKNYEEAWLWKGNCENEFQKYKASVRR